MKPHVSLALAGAPVAAALAVALAGCPGPSAENPARLWLALDGSEIKVRLVEQEPVPF